MLDILVSLIEELFGTKKAPPPAQPRRRMRQAGQAGQAGSARPQQRAAGNRPDYGNPWLDQPTTPVGRTNPPEFEAMVRQFFGMEAEEEIKAEPPVPAPPPAPARIVQAARSSEAGPVTMIERSVSQPLTGTFAVSPSPDEVVPGAGQSQARDLRTMARGLRSNPDAAREAFLYAEIFGPPLADKY